MTVCINYVVPRATGNEKEIFGLQVAIRNWLAMYLRHARQEKLVVTVSDRDSNEEVKRIAARLQLPSDRLDIRDARYPRENLQGIDAVFRPDPGGDILLWQRARLQQPGFSVCGLAHAIAGREGALALEPWCMAPSRANDAIICPSQAIKALVRRYWDAYADFLAFRFGTTYRCDVDLPVIPLGVDCAHFAAITTPAKRAEQRKALGIRDDEIVLLWVGRLSFALKAHPLPMFQAAEKAARETGKPVRLVMMGYFFPEEHEEKFTKLAADICRAARVDFIRNDDPRFKDGLWASGDIFFSLIDSPQESFGLTPIEAMASGLPTVISDWDGYRDGLRNGIDGFLIPTTQPPAGYGMPLAEALLHGEYYAAFLAKTAQFIAVDHEAATQALVMLINDPAKRKAMGASGRQRASEIYDWPQIIRAQEELWKDLAERNAGAKNPALADWPAMNPHALDPFALHEGYATSALEEQDKLSAAMSGEMVMQLCKHDMNCFALDMMLPADKLALLLQKFAGKPAITVADLVKDFTAHDRMAATRTLVWLMKLGAIRRA